MKKVFISNGSALVACYEKALKRNPNLKTVDRVAARFILQNSGTVTEAVLSPRVDGELEKCIGSAMKRWKFPAFAGESAAQIELPVLLKAK